ncbi:fungal hydrophobin [Cubamyces menziesii]|nr:fungal hydrophobin [Cubamyces menziesii]
MFSRLAIATMLAAPLLAVAQSCSTGPIQCCNSVQSVDSITDPIIVGILDAVGDVTGLVGLGCSPINVIGIGQGLCSANAVCCQNNNVGGLISIGCVPVVL